MKLQRVCRRVRFAHGLVLAPAAAVVAVWVFILAAPSLPVGVLSALVASPSNAAPPPLPEPREPTEAELVARDWAQAYRQRDLSRAIELGLELTGLAPDNSTHAYNLACVYSLNAQPDKAVRWLARAADNGFSIVKLFETDPDLERVRSHVGYQAALTVVRETRAAQLAGFRAKFEQTPLHVVLPPDYRSDQPTPLIFALHGKSGRAPGIAEQWRDMAAEMGAILVSPQAVIPFGGGFSWCQADTLDSLCDNAEFLIRLAFEYVVKKYNIDRERVILTGFSEGGFVSQLVGPRYPYLFTGVIPMGCGYLREYDQPAKAVGDRPPRFFFMAGERDHAFPTEQVLTAARDYIAAGFPAKARIYPKVGHQFPIKRDEELRKALDFVMQR